MARSPYIKYPSRLADLIAAIQVMGTYRYANRRVAKWEGRLGRKPVSAPDWKTLFLQHPEFFTFQDENVSLVWRRSHERNYDTHEHRTLSRDEAMAMAVNDPETTEIQLSRPPLETTEVAKLIDVAISVHEREINHQQERRWWLTAVLGILALLVSIVVRH